MRTVRSIAMALLATVLGAAGAHAADMNEGSAGAPQRSFPGHGVESTWWSTDLAGDGPMCGEPRLHRNMMERFEHREIFAFQSSLTIDTIEGDRELFFEPVEKNVRTVAIRTCEATAFLSDGSRHRLVYEIRDRGSWFGVQPGIMSFCVAGLDRYHMHEPACRVLAAR